MKTITKTIPILIVVTLLLPLISCKEKSNPPDPNFVTAVSSGFLGNDDPVVIRFYSEQDITKPLPKNAVQLKPSVKGTVSWQDEYTLVFSPFESYKPGQEYKVSVNVKSVPKFDFNFLTFHPAFSMYLNPVQIAGIDDVLVSGYVIVSDMDLSKLEKVISSKELGKPYWTIEYGECYFYFDTVKRGDASYTVEISYNASAVGVNERGSQTIVIPGKDQFEMLGTRFVDGVIEVTFSSAIKTNQDLRGFISVSGNTQARYSVESNILKIFGEESAAIPPGAELLIQDLEDINGNRLKSPVSFTVPAEWELPEIRFANSGVVLPTSQGAQLVIETRNLSGVLVEAFHIYNDNMLQFLQENTRLSGAYELDRVGEPVWKKAYDFQWTANDQNRWIKRGLDMSDLSKRFPGGMLHIRVSFRPRHVEYNCSKPHGDFSNLEFPDDTFPSIGQYEESFWNRYYYSQGYNWNQWYNNRDDPCHPAFYIPYGSRNVMQTRNILVSDLGLFAKRGNDNSWLIATTNLLTGRASGNTDFTVHNFQGRALFQGKTGSDGTFVIPKERADQMGPGSRLVLTSQNNLGRAYLRMNDSNALNVSHFDIAGGSPSAGLRGLIYGERDVWRPGDEVFLTFLLADPAGTLPANHPISFEVEDPLGRNVINRSTAVSVDGFYSINFNTASNAPTGNWTARVKVGGSTFTKNVRIETIMPNRLKMELDFGGDTGSPLIVSAGTIKSGQQNVTLKSEWLYGAAAANLKADITVSFADRETAFPGYQNFVFKDPSRTVSSERQEVWEGNLNNEGRANFQVNLNPGTSVPGKVNARFITRIFEPSGVFSSEQANLEYSPYSRYVGLKLPTPAAGSRDILFTGADHKAEIVILDEDGKPVTQNVNLECAIYKINWRWWWERTGDEAADFASQISRSPVSRGTVTARDGKAEWSFRINEPEWGRYLVIARDRDGGHAAAQVVYIDWPHWSSRAGGGQESSSTLVLTASKPSYNAGERAQITFPSNKEASAFIVLEKGGNIIKSEWIQCADETTRYEFAVDSSMLPNLFVHVTLLQPHMQTQNDLPIRLFGIVPVLVEDPAVVLRPVITAPDNWEAESQVSFSVKEETGRPMTYTVAVVDEGLLGLTRYSAPNPRNSFYEKEASFLKSWDIYNEVMSAYSGRLETLLSIGGSDDLSLDSSKETQRFKPVVRFFGPFEIGRGENKTETFELPPYIGSVRIMVLAASSSKENRARGVQRAYGTAEQSVKVTSDLMVFATLPRVLSCDDEVEVPVFVTSLRDGARSVRVTLTVPGAQITGNATQTVSFTRSGEELVRFKVKAPSNPGQLQFTARAESSGLKTAQHVVDMEVRSTAIPITKSLYQLINPGDAWRGTLDYPGRDGSNTLAAGFSRLPPINLESRLGWLVQYPHGCAEQTTSGAFPQLYLDKIINMNDAQRAELRANVNQGINRITGMQLVSGGFSYWPGEGAANDWASSYAGHFLLEARKAGYPVPQSVISNWVRYQKNVAANWQANSGRSVEQAYRLYTLALANEADIGSMNRLRSQQNLPALASWRLAAAYWLAGQRETARAMTQRLAMPQGNYRELSQTFGSAFRDKAMILETLVIMNAGHDRIFPLYEEMSRELSSDQWLSTQETAYALVAMIPYMQQNAAAGSITMEYNAAGKSGSLNFSTAADEQNFGAVTGTRTTYTITNKSAVPIYAVLTSKGIPEEGKEPALSEGLALNVQYRSNGRAIDPASLKLGDDMEVVVSVRNTHSQEVEEIALIVPVPASWEINNTRLAETAETAFRNNFRYQDIRDDRVLTYFNLNRNEERTIRFNVTKTYEGNFSRPAIHAYAMYDESIRALVPGVK